ncbi:MAG: hypothetical protein ACRYFX_10920 [Janthinobacterium lividum]
MTDYLVLAEAYGSVLADEQVPCVIVQFHGFANSEQFKHIMDTGLAYYQAHSQPARPWGWVGDTRTMSAIPKDVQTWLTTDWNLRAYAAGIREISIVVSQNVMGQMATQHYATKTAAEQVTYEIEPAYYDSLETAKQGAARRLA